MEPLIFLFTYFCQKDDQVDIGVGGVANLAIMFLVVFMKCISTADIGVGGNAYLAILLFMQI